MDPRNSASAICEVLIFFAMGLILCPKLTMIATFQVSLFKWPDLIVCHME